MYTSKHPFQLFRELMSEGNVPSPILLCGKEQLLVDWARGEIIKKYINPASKAMDYTVLDEVDLVGTSIREAIIEASEMPPILSEKRVVLVRNTKMLESGERGDQKNSELGKLCAYLEDLPEYTILIFTGGTVDKRLKLGKTIGAIGKVFDFGQLERSDFINFSSKRFRDAGIHVSREVMDYLVDNTGYYNREGDYDLYTFSNDIVKMIALTEDGSLTKETVAEATETADETFIFALLDSIVINEKGKALEMLRNMVSSSSDAIRITSQIIGHFEVMYSIKEYQSAGAPDRMILDNMGIKEARLRMMKRFTDRFDLKKLKSILLSAYKIERDIKMGLLGYETALEVFVSKL